MGVNSKQFYFGEAVGAVFPVIERGRLFGGCDCSLFRGQWGYQ
jgi:hypothetical protein